MIAIGKNNLFIFAKCLTMYSFWHLHLKFVKKFGKLSISKNRNFEPISNSLLPAFKKAHEKVIRKNS
jgi:hypothetical protein